MQSTIGAQSPVKRRRCQPKGFDCTCTYYDQDADDQLGCRSRAMDAESRRYRDLTQASSAFEHPGQWIAAYAQVWTWHRAADFRAATIWSAIRGISAASTQRLASREY